MTFVVTTIAFRLPSCHKEIFQAHQHQATVSHSAHLLVHTPVSTDKQLCTTSASIALDTLAFKTAPCDGIAGVPCVVATCVPEVSLRFSMHKVMKRYTPWMSPYETTSPSKSLRIVHPSAPLEMGAHSGHVLSSLPKFKPSVPWVQVFKSRSRSTIKPSGGRTLLLVPRNFRTCFICRHLLPILAERGRF